jgi:hypothetical protein
MARVMAMIVRQGILPALRTVRRIFLSLMPAQAGIQT